MRRALLLVVLSGGLIAVGAAPAGAAFPVARNGRIVFEHKVGGTTHVFVMNADGSNRVDLSPPDTLGDYSPQFSPNGQQIVFWRHLPNGGAHTMLMASNGSGTVDLTPGLQEALYPTFSPDGHQIAFVNDTNPAPNLSQHTLTIMNADGSGLRDLTPGTSEDEYLPDFSPDGSRIVFSGPSVIEAVGVDGSGLTPLSTPGELIDNPVFSPTGTELAWYEDPNAGNLTAEYDIFVGNPLGAATDVTPDGSAVQQKSPSFSPDASEIAFEDNGGHVYVMGANGASPTNLSPGGGDRWPHWEYVYMCAKRRATIVGDDGPETIRGTKHRDVIVGNGGNDTIKGLGGNDRICGGSGKDVLIGGGGTDKLIGGPGKDKLVQ